MTCPGDLCPRCGGESKCYDTRRETSFGEYGRYRRRHCLKCPTKWTTREVLVMDAIWGVTSILVCSTCGDLFVGDVNPQQEHLQELGTCHECEEAEQPTKPTGGEVA